MREIKFRIYDKGRNEWVHGPGDEVSLFGECILCGELLRRDSDDTHVRLQDLNDMVALQFTGLKDKNGVEIYEGDIVELDVTLEKEIFPFPDDDGEEDIHHEGTFKVYWNTENACFDLTKITGNTNGWFLQESESELEVISSIYSNPEPLKK